MNTLDNIKPLSTNPTPIAATPTISPTNGGTSPTELSNTNKASNMNNGTKIAIVVMLGIALAVLVFVVHYILTKPAELNPIVSQPASCDCQPSADPEAEGLPCPPADCEPGTAGCPATN